MAFNSEAGKATYTASASQTVFPFLFKIYLASDLKVYQTPSGSTPDDTADLLILTTDYTVTINGDAGGEITLVSGATLNDTIVIERALVINRDVDYQTGGDLLADTLDADQDYQTYLILDSKTESDRLLKLPSTDVNMSSSLPTSIANYALFVNAEGTKFEYRLGDETGAALEAWNSQAEAMTSASYATQAEDVFVDKYTSDGDGTFTATPTTDYSSPHWAAKAATFNPALYALLAGATFTGQVKGITPVAAEDFTRKDYVDDKTESGTYTPTLTGIENVDSSTLYTATYIRVGNIVTVYIRLAIDATVTATTTRLSVSLPIASDLGATQDLTGIAVCSTVEDITTTVHGDITEDDARFFYTPTLTSLLQFSVNFSYEIIT